MSEEECLNKITVFNKTTKGIKQDIEVLIRAVCSILQINRTTQAGLELIKSYPEGTIFTRTCRGGGGGGGVCGEDLARDTTFTNMSTLGNLMIGNPKSINDSVVFLKTKTDVKFLDLTVVAQLFGAPLKSGVPAQDELGSGGLSRGIFSACCPIPDMVDFCRRLGVHGVIQIDSADAYYFNKDAHWIPNALKQGTVARHIANELVLEAIINKRAYPVFQEDKRSGEAFVGIGNHPRLANSGALFPEFNFHTKELKECLEYCTIHDPILFQEGRPLYTLAEAAAGAIHEVKNWNTIAKEADDKAIDPELSVAAAADIRSTAEAARTHAENAAAAIPFEMFKVRRIDAKLRGGGVKRKRDITTDYYEVPYWNLNKILSNDATARVYLNFQKDDYPFQQISDYQWVEVAVVDVHNFPLQLRIKATLVARQRLINTKFQSSFVGLPYLHENINELVKHFEIPIIQLLFSDDQIADCVKQEGTVTIWDGTEYTKLGGGRKVKRKKRTPYRKQKTKRNSKLKPRRRRKGRTRRTRYKKKRRE